MDDRTHGMGLRRGDRAVSARMALPPGASRTGGSRDKAVRTLVHGEAGAVGPGGSSGDGTVRTWGAAAPAVSPNRSPVEHAGGDDPDPEGRGAGIRLGERAVTRTFRPGRSGSRSGPDGDAPVKDGPGNAGGPLASCDEWIGRFCRHLADERGLSAHTVQGYRRDLTVFSRYIDSMGVRDWPSIDARMVRGFVACDTGTR